MPAQVEISLGADDKSRLEKNVRSRATSVRLRERSQIVLLAAAKVPNYQIAEQLGLDVNTVGRGRNRYASEGYGYAGIEKNRPRGANHGGKNSADQARIRSLIIDKRTQEKAAGRHALVGTQPGASPGGDAFSGGTRLARGRTQTASGKAFQGQQ